jgi:hypothetical protein
MGRFFLIDSDYSLKCLKIAFVAIPAKENRRKTSEIACKLKEKDIEGRAIDSAYRPDL